MVLRELGAGTGAGNKRTQNGARNGGFEKMVLRIVCLNILLRLVLKLFKYWR